MNDLARSIRLLYEPDASPVIAVSGGIILFFNSAARSVFPSLEENAAASKLLPRSFLTCDDEVFVATAQVNGQALVANGVWNSGMLLLRIHHVSPSVTISTESITTNLRIELATMGIALEQLRANENTDAAALSVLESGYYKLLRCTENIDIAHQLAAKKCFFRPSSVLLAEWLQEVLVAAKPMAAYKGISIVSKIGTDISYIQADTDLLETLLLNLLSNSIRFSEAGKKIQVRLTKDGPWLKLSVEDSGSGITNGTLGRLFSQQLGMPALLLGEHKSLGLYVVWGIAALHGGSVTISNRAKGGTAVRVCLPIESRSYLPMRSPQMPYLTKMDLNKRVRIGLADALPPKPVN